MCRTAGAALLAVLTTVAPAVGQIGVTSPGNKHNLSVTGPGPMKAIVVTEICVFCHTPHNATPAVPLWNQALSAATTYQPYASSTLKAPVGLPTGSSKLCLACHDGTVAMGSTINKGLIAMQGTSAQGMMTGGSVIGTDLRRSHPISFAPITGGSIVNPPAGSPVKLDGSGQLQCRSCHDPHRMNADTTTMKFLVMSNAASGMCVICHTQPYWQTGPSTHKTSTKAYTAVQGAHTGYATVEANGCESCHKPHAANAAARGLKAVEEAGCGSAAFQCHGSSAIGRNIEAEFRKTYSHPTYQQTPSSHEASESPSNPAFTMPEVSPAAMRHAECPDCHNAHATNAVAATRPKGSGKVAGVWGVGADGTLRLPGGTPASVNEYEICFKCHGDSANKPQQNGSPAGPYPNRVASQFNMRLMFSPTSPSSHPIVGPRTGRSVPSLINGWTTSSVMYCTDCHDNDQGPRAATPGTGPSGPHGSSFKHLLAARYEMDAGSYPNSTAAYALCYKCHSQSIILSAQSFKGHDKHVVSASTPCSVCHDAHGISSTQGNATNNSFLMNFDKRFVTPSSSGILRFDDLGAGQVRCYLTCHGKNHNPYSY